MSQDTHWLIDDDDNEYEESSSSSKSDSYPAQEFSSIRAVET